MRTRDGSGVAGRTLRWERTDGGVWRQTKGIDSRMARRTLRTTADTESKGRNKSLTRLETRAPFRPAFPRFLRTLSPLCATQCLNTIPLLSTAPSADTQRLPCLARRDLRRRGIAGAVLLFGTLIIARLVAHLRLLPVYLQGPVHQRRPRTCSSPSRRLRESISSCRERYIPLPTSLRHRRTRQAPFPRPPFLPLSRCHAGHPSSTPLLHPPFQPLKLEEPVLQHLFVAEP